MTETRYQLITGSPINVKDFGAVGDGITDDTTAIQDALDNLSDNSTLDFGDSHYVFSASLGTSLSSKTNVTLRASGATITQPLLTSDVLGGSTRRTFDILNCTNVVVKGFNFIGRHLDYATGKDNSKQVAVLFTGCTGGGVFNCTAEKHLVSYYINTGCSELKVSDCDASTCRTGVEVTGSDDIDVKRCNVRDARYYPDGGSSELKTSGYSFLANLSINVRFSDCYSLRAASDCYRVQHDTDIETNVSILNCVSKDPRRESLSIRDISCGNISVNGLYATGIGDPAVWTGGDYLEPYTAGTVTGAVINKVTNLSVTNCQFLGKADMEYAILIIGDCATVSFDNITSNAPSGEGITVQSPYDVTGLSINNCNLTAGLSTGDYVISLGSGVVAPIVNNNFLYGGVVDGILCVGNDGIISNNICDFNGRHGISVTGERNSIHGNTARNSGQVSTGAGIKVAGDDNSLGMNTTIDLQVSTTMDYSLWITDVTGTVLGKLSSFGITSIRRDGTGLANDGNPTYGKAAIATDAATIISEMQSAGMMEST